MQSKRPSFLAHHMRSFNRSLKPRYPRKWLLLYSIAVTVLALDLGWLHYQTHQNQSTGISVRSAATPERTIDLIWRGETQAGIPVVDKDGKLSFSF